MVVWMEGRCAVREAREGCRRAFVGLWCGGSAAFSFFVQMNVLLGHC